MTDPPPLSDAPDLVAAAEALLNVLGGAHGTKTQRLAEELEYLETLLKEVQAYEELLLSEHTDTARRKELIETLFTARAARASGGADRLRTLRGIAGRFRTLLQGRQGKVEVLLTTAVELSDEQRASATARLEQALAQIVVLTTTVEPGLLGGARVQIGDSVFDASLSARLKNVRERLSSAVAEAANAPDVTPS